MSSGKILIILSDAHSFDMTKPDGTIVEEETGFFLMELAKPLAAILDAGYDVEFASPNGQKPNIDPLSKSLGAFMGNFWEKEREEKLIDRMRVEKNLYSPRPFRDISDQELESFKGVFVPGGHAPMTDLGADPELGRILLHFHNKSKPTAIICHGPYALHSTKVAPGSDGKFAYAGYNITSWSDADEKLVETMKGGEIEKVASSLQDAGANMQTSGMKRLGSITVDREVVSGANPMAAGALGAQFVTMLKA